MSVRSGATPQTISGAIDKIFTVDLNSRITLKRNYDDWFFKQWFSDVRRKRLAKVQKVKLSEHQKLGPDVAVSRFVVGYCRGQIKNERGNWIRSLKDLPDFYSKTHRVIAIQARNAELITEAMDNFIDLEYLESLDLSENPRLDDFACDQLSRQFRRSKVLREINLSFNPLISVYGLEILFRIPSIRKMIAIGSQAANHEEVDLFTLAAEDEKDCEIIVHKGGLRFKNPDLNELGLVTPLLTR